MIMSARGRASEVFRSYCRRRRRQRRPYMYIVLSNLSLSRLFSGMESRRGAPRLSPLSSNLGKEGGGQPRPLFSLYSFFSISYQPAVETYLSSVPC